MSSQFAVPPLQMILSAVLVIVCISVAATAFRPVFRPLVGRLGYVMAGSRARPSLLMASPNADYPSNMEVMKSRWTKSTKQLATLGPASNTFEAIEKLFLAGADIFRLNFSHGEHSEKAALVDIIRAIETKYNHPICILGDLQGPKLRVGVFEKDSVMLIEGQDFTFDLKDEPGDGYRVKLPHPEILNTLTVGDVLLVDDGKMKMTVQSADMETKGSVTCTVNVGGKISNRKGVNTPSILLPISPLTKKDRKDLEFLLTLSIDWVALSFVQTPEDIKELKDLVKALGGKVPPPATDTQAHTNANTSRCNNDRIHVCQGARHGQAGEAVCYCPLGGDCSTQRWHHGGAR